MNLLECRFGSREPCILVPSDHVSPIAGHSVLGGCHCVGRFVTYYRKSPTAVGSARAPRKKGVSQAVMDWSPPPLAALPCQGGRACDHVIGATRMNITRVAIDFTKNVFQVHGGGYGGYALLRRHLATAKRLRDQLCLLQPARLLDPRKAARAAIAPRPRPVTRSAAVRDLLQPAIDQPIQSDSSKRSI